VWILREAGVFRTGRPNVMEILPSVTISLNVRPETSNTNGVPGPPLGYHPRQRGVAEGSCLRHVCRGLYTVSLADSRAMALSLVYVVEYNVSEGTMPRQVATATKPPARAPLDRQRVLAAALLLVDSEGLEALSMRRLGAELGVEAMSLYKHVANKEALLDGIVEQLWTEVGTAQPSGADWAELLRGFAHGVRAMMHRHPQAAGLLLSRCVLPPPLLEILTELLESLRKAGFDEATTGRAVRSLWSYTIGSASNELYSLGAWRPVSSERSTSDQDAITNGNTTDILLWLGRTLPPDTPSRVVRTALALIDYDPEQDFDATLDIVIHGLRPPAAEKV
jgi:AcrR family transcriptional regulator